MMRLDKFLARQGLGSRNAVRALLRAGRVLVDGQAATDPAMHIDPERAVVTLDGQTLAYEATLTLMMNKPAGVLTAADDPRRRTVMDLLPPRMAAMGCMPVGRLDLDTEGLLLFTTEGELAHRLLSPKRHVDKVYIARLDGAITPDDVQAFAEGLPLSDFTALPARLEALEGFSARVTLREGRFHQVKRMFAARGRQVLALKRVAFGGLPLDEGLAPGAYRVLTEEEMAILRAGCGL
jgi:16S rRNA pseudouridine516 synthase